MENENKNAPDKAEVKRTVRREPRRREQPKPPKVELIITVVNREKAEFYADYLQSFDVNMQFIMQAHGTASEEILSYLGTTAADKAVIFSIIRQDRIKEALAGLSEKFSSIKRGKGISFTVPLTSTIGVAVYQFMINQTQGGRR